MLRKRRHSTRACIHCIRAKRRCVLKPSERKCARCKNRREVCNFEPQKKRGRKPKEIQSPQYNGELYSFNEDYKFKSYEGLLNKQMCVFLHINNQLTIC